MKKKQSMIELDLVFIIKKEISILKVQRKEILIM